MAFLPEEQNFYPGQIIIGIEEQADIKAIVTEIGVEIIDEISAHEMFLVRVPEGQENEYIQKAQAKSGVKFAELNFKMQLM